MRKKLFTNHLIHESSPYLLQHAHNPVNWFSWSDEVLQNAQDNNKLILISIGYAACHWCHVMEQECFESEEVAKVMNNYFINIKVDREERPDIDQIYMNALQLMTGHGGWPLNIIALPNGIPVWGATYLSKHHWIEVLEKINHIFINEPKILFDYGNQLKKGIDQIEALPIHKPNSISEINYEIILKKWSKLWDVKDGGDINVPKFMMPNQIHFLLRYACQNKDKDIQNFVINTLNKMAFGGIFDHVNGGFSRYSTDKKWHIPHFEKMLYDNAQLVSLYSDAYLATKTELYKKVVFKTLHFIENELFDKNGWFYSALDADSFNPYGVLEEGAYYVFTQKELVEIIDGDFELFKTYFNINEYGHWENDQYVLIRTLSDDEICKQFKITPNELENKLVEWNEKLSAQRALRLRPQLDFKIITSCNAMMIKGYVDAYRVFKEEEYLSNAIKCADLIEIHLIEPNGLIYRNFTKYKKKSVGFLEDYAFTIQAFISLYQVTFNDHWILLAKKLTDYVISNFYDENKQLFYFISKTEKQLISNPMDYRDNVVPSSNSVMAKNLFWLGKFFNQKTYSNIAQQMLSTIYDQITSYPSSYSNWLDLILNNTHPFYEVVITGQKAICKLKELNSTYIPNIQLAGSINDNHFSLLKDRYVPDKTLIYVCTNQSCDLPSSSVSNAILKIKTTYQD